MPFRVRIRFAAPLVIAALAAAATLPLWVSRSARSAEQDANLPPGPAAPAPEPLRISGSPKAHFGLQGSGGCAAAACHGGPAGEDQPTLVYRAGGEYGIWVERDPHSRAYDTLLTPRSRQMVRRLGLQVPAHQARVCLACHATLADGQLESAPEQMVAGSDPAWAHLRDGVGCESCHGPSREWLSPHKQVGWRARFDVAGLDFIDQRRVELRAQTCVKCHVGSPGRDVDHDLIAAGHPRLTFELAAYEARLPHHWSRSADVARNAPLEARLWIVGQLTSAEAALDQLVHRATQKLDVAGRPEGNPKPGPWPEFAELSCFACHHNLAYASWRQDPGRGGKLGQAAWGTWQFSAIPLLTGAPFRGELAELRTQMGISAPDRAAVTQLAQQLQTELRGELERYHTGRSISGNLIDSLIVQLANQGQFPVSDWDEATQAYLGMAALSLSQREAGELRNPEPKRVFESLRSMRDLLQYPRTDDGPKFDSPAKFGVSDPDGLDRSLLKFNQCRAALGAR